MTFVFMKIASPSFRTKFSVPAKQSTVPFLPALFPVQNASASLSDGSQTYPLIHRKIQKHNPAFHEKWFPVKFHLSEL